MECIIVYVLKLRLLQKVNRDIFQDLKAELPIRFKLFSITQTSKNASDTHTMMLLATTAHLLVCPRWESRGSVLRICPSEHTTLDMWSYHVTYLVPCQPECVTIFQHYRQLNVNVDCSNSISYWLCIAGTWVYNF